MSSESYDAWASAPNSRQGLIALNTRTIFEQRVSDVARIHTDGWWGEHEWTAFPQPFDATAPYLGYIPLPTGDHDIQLDVDILWKTPFRRDMVQTSDKPRLYSLKAALLGRLNQRIEWAKGMKFQLQHAALTDMAETITIPFDALLRARVARADIRDGLPSWNQLLMCVRAAQRGLLEVTAFILWWRDIDNGGHDNSITGNARRAMRGCISPDRFTYRDISRHGFPIFLALDLSTASLDYGRRVRGTARGTRVQTVGDPRPVTEHEGPLWFYPPKTDTHIKFESAARGYSPRIDEWKPSAQYQSMHGKGKDRRWVREVQHPELRRWLSDRPSDRPEYLPHPVAIWDQAMLHACDHRILKSQDKPRKFDLPPPPLFWGRAEELQTKFYLRAHQLYASSERRIRPRQPGFTTQGWRDFLSDTYWKKATPKMNEQFDPTSDYIFNDELFYQFGSPSFFTPEDDAQVKAGHLIPITPMACGCQADRDTFDNLDNRATFIYKLTLHSFLLDLGRLDAELGLSGSDVGRDLAQVHASQTRGELLKRFVFFNGVDRPPAWCVDRVTGRMGWLVVLRDIVSAYPVQKHLASETSGFDPKILTQVENMIAEPQANLCNVEIYLLAVLADTIKSNLGIYPPPLLMPPKYYTLACTEHRQHHI
ncbi:hypothetical protein FA95DRAFT_1609676 [Auriscalpium vulgare]|uniref:Uncharacterized protein n=1 Tax=Auriscalpium vulgare TaxID=40419 RepID=A0ACB8RG77_9AGAM|nr:hypothetical protein FA95DRAFT_1609676 [Auriscalpium vulgare]